MDSSWVYAGIGVRLAQDIGSHRRKIHDPAEVMDGELYKRAFWTLIYLEQTIAAVIGKPCTTYDEE